MIEFLDISKRFGEQIVLSEVSFRVDPGEHVGIVGPNGAGKSSLFEIIQGNMGQDKGDVNLPKDVRLGHLRQQLNAHAVKHTLLEYVTDAIPQLNAMHEEIVRLEHDLAETDEANKKRLLHRLGDLQHDYEHLGGYEMETRAEKALSGLGFSVESMASPFQSFSGGWQMRAELARTLISRPDILLLDEPSNYLDVPAVEWLQGYLRSFAGTMMLISHDRYLLESLTDVTLEVAGGQVTRYQGNYSYYIRMRQERHDQLTAAKKNQDRKREEVERFIERFRAKNTKASQVQSRMKALDKMEIIEVPDATVTQTPIHIPPPPHCGNEVIRMEDLGLWYEKDEWIMQGVNFSLARGDKMALVGYNGMGKTTLLRLMSGTLPPVTGQRTLGHKVILGYQSQEFAETMPPDQSAYNVVKDAAPAARIAEVRGILGRFGFTRDSVDKPVSVLSGGEKIRLAFARIFINPPNLLLLDEPTTHLDIRGRETLEQALVAYTGTVCLVSHDIEFVRRVATSILAITEQGVATYPGNYDYYREKSGSNVEPAESKPSQPKQTTPPPAEKKKGNRKKLSNKEREAWKTLPSKIESLEKELEELEAKMMDPDFFRGDPKEVGDAVKRTREIPDSIERAYARWAELDERA